jgi:hypothetical protein
MGLPIRQKLSSLGSILAIDAPSPTGCLGRGPTEKRISLQCRRSVLLETALSSSARPRCRCFAQRGDVCCSTTPSQRSACSRLSPHMSGSGCSEPHTAGRSGWPKMAQRLSAVSWMQRTPAGLPSGMPGMGVEMDGAMQHAPQPGRQFMGEGNRLCRVVGGCAVQDIGGHRLLLEGPSGTGPRMPCGMTSPAALPTIPVCSKNRQRDVVPQEV